MIYFYNEHETGTQVMRGEQVARQLSLTGTEATCITHTDVKDSVVIAIKYIGVNNLKKLKENNNTVILDILDLFAYKRWAHELISLSFVDGAIVCSEAVRDHFHPWMPETVAVIPHHWDPRAMDHIEDPEYFAIGYIGEKFNHEYADIKHVVPVYENWVENMGKFGCHYAVRNPDSPAALFKPATKVANAAAVELLGDDYPYYVDYDRLSIESMVAKVRHDYTTDHDDWRKGLRMMTYVRKVTALPSCAEGYRNYIDSFNRG